MTLDKSLVFLGWVLPGLGSGKHPGAVNEGGARQGSEQDFERLWAGRREGPGSGLAGGGSRRAGPDLEHKHLSTEHSHCVEVAIADVGAILVGPLCGSGLGWGPWLGGPLWLPTWMWWLRRPRWLVVWPSWPPGPHSGERLGGLWLTIWRAYGEEGIRQ